MGVPSAILWAKHWFFPWVQKRVARWEHRGLDGNMRSPNHPRVFFAGWVGSRPEGVSQWPDLRPLLTLRRAVYARAALHAVDGAKAARQKHVASAFGLFPLGPRP